MAMLAKSRANVRLPPEVNRILLVRNLPFKISSDEMYDLFGKYGAIRQIRMGNESDTKGTAFVVYEDIFDAMSACQHLSGFNVLGRYLICLYYQPNKQLKKGSAGRTADLDKREADLEKMKRTHGVD